MTKINNLDSTNKNVYKQANTLKRDSSTPNTNFILKNKLNCDPWCELNKSINKSKELRNLNNIQTETDINQSNRNSNSNDKEQSNGENIGLAIYSLSKGNSLRSKSSIDVSKKDLNGYLLEVKKSNIKIDLDELQEPTLYLNNSIMSEAFNTKMQNCNEFSMMDPSINQLSLNKGLSMDVDDLSLYNKKNSVRGE